MLHNANAQEILERIKEAKTITLVRQQRGGLSVIVDGTPAKNDMRNNRFVQVISNLVEPSVKPSEVGRVELRAVAPQVEFSAGSVPRYFNIAFYGLFDARIGDHDVLKPQEEVASSLAIKLSLG